MKTQKIKKIIYICNHSSFFLSHRYNLLDLCLQNNFEHQLFIGRSASKKLEEQSINQLKKKGTKYKIFNFHTSKLNLFNELITLLRLFFNIIIKNPNIVHAVTNKPIIYSIIISNFVKANFILSFSGFGYLYTNKKNTFKKNIYELIFKIFLNKKCTFIVQNSRDYEYLNKNFKIKKNKIFLIKGSGINLIKYKSNINIKNNNIILFPARPLFSKGIREFCESAKIIKKKYKSWRFVVVGDFNYQSPDLIDQNFRLEYQKDNIVEFWGYQENMISVYKKSKIVCLPSYREGFPRVFMEAAAMGLPVITSDDSGCVEAILVNETGYIVPKKNISILVDKIINIMNNQLMHKKFSKNSVIHAHNSFSIKNVTDMHLKIYNDIINE